MQVGWFGLSVRYSYVRVVVMVRVIVTVRFSVSVTFGKVLCMVRVWVRVS